MHAYTYNIILMSDNITIDKINKIANKIGVTCIDTEYINLSTKLTWKCENNHSWKRTWATAKKRICCM